MSQKAMEIKYPEYLKEFLKQPVAFTTVSGRVYTHQGVAAETCLKARTGGGRYNNPVGALIKAGTLEDQDVIFVWLLQTQGLLRDFKTDQKIYLGKYWYQHVELAAIPNNEYLRDNKWVIGHVIRKDKSFTHICIDKNGNLTLGSRENAYDDSSFHPGVWLPHTRARAMRLCFINDARNGLGVYNCVSGGIHYLANETKEEINKVFPAFDGNDTDAFSSYLLHRVRDLTPQAKANEATRREAYARLIRESKESDDFRAACHGADFGEETYCSSSILYKYDGKLIQTTVNSHGVPYNHNEYHIFDGTKHVCVDEEGYPKIPRYDSGFVVATRQTVDDSPIKKLEDANIDVFYKQGMRSYSQWGYKNTARRLLDRHRGICAFDSKALRILRHEKVVEQLINMGCKNLAAMVLADAAFISKNVYKKFSALTKVCGYTAKQLKILDGHVSNTKMGDYGFSPSINQSLRRILERLDFDPDIKKRDIDPATFEKIIRLSCVPYWNISSLVEIMERDHIGNNWFERVRKLTTYLPTDTDQADETILDLLSDYTRMRNRFIEVDNSLPLLPPVNKVREYHDELVRRQAQLEMRLNKERAELMNKKYANVYKKASKFEFEEGPYSIVCPKGVEELVYEGKVLCHCVGSYQESVADGREYILFLRRSNAKDIPWYTIDILPNGSVRQIHTKHNGCIDKDAEGRQIMEFLRHWCAATGASSLNNIDGALCALR